MGIVSLLRPAGTENVCEASEVVFDEFEAGMISRVTLAGSESRVMAQTASRT
ncbi:hypothetical protein BT96DRAFT_926960 [Gymnopus androsaceus JB14]|uniref:Uncharacterized protein n=1 Tax=Gymnopus androsaceus JB14 TaxID=1447944 RepID=A0A6A4GT89_9AGAR|nr:hypothetical protein BT96DRAFT_926960 [Gymnopus androsaceus JB14]